MLGKWATKLAIFLLRHSRIDNESRQLLTTEVLQKLGALPLRARIRLDDAGQIFIDGQKMTLEAARKMRMSSKALLNNFARRIVREQVTYMAINIGVHQNTSPEQGLYAKAALWGFQEEDELYAKFAQVEDSGEE